MKAQAINSPLLFAFSRFYYDVKDKRKRLKNTILLLVTLLGKKSINILLADDDEASREIFVEAIEDIAPHINVSVAVNGQDLMNILFNEKTVLPDVIFLDLNMPLKNGRECLEEIRNDKRLKGIPVIIYSTSSSREHIEETFKMGASFYMPKPDTFTDLKLIAKKILSLDWEGHISPEREKFVLLAHRIK